MAIHPYLSRAKRPKRWAEPSRSVRLQRVRNHLHAMEGELSHARDWRPSILAFSEGAERRARLMRFAQWIEGGAAILRAYGVGPLRANTVLLSWFDPKENTRGAAGLIGEVRFGVGAPLSGEPRRPRPATGLDGDRGPDLRRYQRGPLQVKDHARTGLSAGRRW